LASDVLFTTLHPLLDDMLQTYFLTDTHAFIVLLFSTLWSENLKGRDHSEDLGVDGRIILEWILRETEWEAVE